MKVLTLPNILLIVSAGAILLALALAGGSLSKSVKWNLYNSGTNYGFKGGNIYRLYAYQTLWTSYDGWGGKNDKVNSQAYTIIKKDSWRRLPRLLVTAAAGTGAVSLAVLLPFSLIPFLRKKSPLLNLSRIASSILSVAAGATLGYALNYYKSKYSALLAPVFYDPKSYYPDEDNMSTGFYMASTACTLLFISATVNIVNVVIFIKTQKNATKPIDKVPEGIITSHPTTKMSDEVITTKPTNKVSDIVTTSQPTNNVTTSKPTNNVTTSKPTNKVSDVGTVSKPTKNSSMTQPANNIHGASTASQPLNKVSDTENWSQPAKNVTVTKSTNKISDTVTTSQPTNILTKTKSSN